MATRYKSSEQQLRQRIAHCAARFMAESGVDSYLVAKQKAAQQMGVTASQHLPSNREIEKACQEYQRIFKANSQPRRLQALRVSALNAMRLFMSFTPRLVGAVLSGTAGEHTEVSLHLFTDTPEEVGLFLLDHAIPYNLGERRLRIDASTAMSYPAYRFMAGDVPVELAVFPLNGLRQAPQSPVDGKPMRRARIAEVEQLVQDAATEHGLAI
ncbi:MAG: hypothetical protein L0Y67_06785 [Gammaproteobacteria bacterium]|nr:hypothetical protein [Gammaproteobacteria bacterium]MCI0591291.1 hypothetical protein [Gammaproteobacteria bacterium]